MQSLTFLALVTNEFNGTIPTSIGSLTALEYFDISDIALTGQLPTEIGGLTALTDLRIARSDLRTTPDGLCGIAEAPPCLSGPIPTEFGNLVNLRTFAD